MRRIRLLFAAATVLPIVALCSLGVRTLDQDRDLERQRRRERLEVAAARVALEIEQDLQRVEAVLVEGRGIRLLPAGLESTADQPILFQPAVVTATSVWPADLLAAAQQEYRNPAAAIAAYQQLAGSSSMATRAEALVALGGLLRRQHRFEEAVRAYTALEDLGAEPVGGQPAALVARQGRGKAFLASGDTARLRDEAAALSRDLASGRLPIDKPTFDLYRELVAAWEGPEVDPVAVQRTTAAAALWRGWRRGELADRGRRLIDVDDTSLLATWVAGRDGPIAALLAPEQLQDRWRPIWESQGLSAALSVPDGRPLFGPPIESAVLLLPADTQLPFVLTIGSSASEPSSATLRHRAVIGGIALLCLLMIAVSYGLYRVTTRELMLARQQSDFVAAVSHEFRTPLTSMRHLIDLLATRGVTSETRKAQYYGLLAGEAERLHRMVETLLSFGRIDAAAHVWQLEPTDPRELIERVAEEFRRHVPDCGLTLEMAGDLPAVRADREAIGRALWNLLENAAKYSRTERRIRLFARRTAATLLIGVQDHGIGIPVAEQRRIFQKFVRGDEAKRAGIRGVGVGLALVQRIVEAHGGSIAVDSVVGRGSTFTMAFPIGHAGNEPA